MALPASQSYASEFVVENAATYNLSSPRNWIISHFFKHKFLIVLFVLGAFGNGALAFAVPALMGMAFNIILAPNPDLDYVGQIAVVLVLSQALRAVLQFMRNGCAEAIGQLVERDTREELYGSLLGKSMTFHSMQAVGDIMARATNDVHEINLMFNPGMNLVVGSAMFMIFPLVFSPQIQPGLILAPLLFTIGYFFSVRSYTKQLRPATDSVRGTFGDMNASLAEAVDGIETVKGASQEKQEIARFERNATLYRDAFVSQSDIEARFIPLLLLGVTESIAFFHALILFRAGQMNVGQVVAYMGYMQMFGFPVFISQFGFSNLSLGFAASRRILELILNRTDLDENMNGHEGTMSGAVRFENVTFSYPGGNTALSDLNFDIKSGQVIAIVGQTGSGKSTLARLINRTYDVSEGRILVDGIDVRDWKLESLRSQISIIEQDIFLFSRTIGENIAFGNPAATREQIEQASRDAQAHDFITSFKRGYETVIGERGVTLSGGQRQRLALARAFLTNPRILILDDSTSAIDSATEDQIQWAINRATEGRTTFLITHRLSQIRWADQIIVLRKGKIAAIGTHEELLKSSIPYRRIFDMDNVTRRHKALVDLPLDLPNS
jgi:ATP-binding cassette, subfamily B, bacterial